MYKCPVLTNLEIRKIRKAKLTNFERALFEIIIETGLKPKELLELNLYNVYTIIDGTYKVRLKDREIEIDRKTFENIFVFLYEYPTIKRIRKAIKSICTKANIKKRLTPYILRHTCIISKIMNRSLVLLSEELGISENALAKYFRLYKELIKKE